MATERQLLSADSGTLPRRRGSEPQQYLIQNTFTCSLASVAELQIYQREIDCNCNGVVKFWREIAPVSVF